LKHLSHFFLSTNECGRKITIDVILEINVQKWGRWNCFFCLKFFANIY